MKDTIGIRCDIGQTIIVEPGKKRHGRQGKWNKLVKLGCKKRKYCINPILKKMVFGVISPNKEQVDVDV